MQSQLTLLTQLCDSVAPLALINFIPKIMKSKFIRIRNSKHFCSSQYLFMFGLLITACMNILYLIINSEKPFFHFCH